MSSANGEHPGMNAEKGQRPIAKVAWFSRYISYWFVNDLIAFARREVRALAPSDLWSLPATEDIDMLMSQFDEQRADDGTAFYRPLLTMGKAHVIVGGFFLLCKIVSETFIPLLSRQVLLSIQAKEFSGLYYVLGFIGLMAVAQFSNQAHFRCMEIAGSRMRAACNFAIYRKAMELRMSEAPTDMLSQAVTLVASDSQRLVDVATQVHLLWASPIQIALGTYFLVLFLGFSSFAAVGILLALYPVSFKMSAVQAALRRKLFEVTQRRVTLISEFLQGVRVVKMYGWEPFLIRAVMIERSIEMFYLRVELGIWVVISTLMIAAPQLALLITFVIFVVTSGTLTAADAFAALSMLTLLKFPVLYFGTAIMMASQAKVGCERIQAYLNYEVRVASRGSSNEPLSDGEELHAGGSSDTTQEGECADNAVVVDLREIDVFWNVTHADIEDNHSDRNPSHAAATTTVGQGSATKEAAVTNAVFSIKNLSLKIKKGEVCAVVGPVGCGKSLLCHALLGEAYIRPTAALHRAPSGAMNNNKPLSTAVAYAAQEPFLMSGTVRENILFFRAYREERYRNVLTACELWADFEIYPDGEMTIVGERGVTLSGGQKARIALARAVYADDCDLVILDDPFSALDSRTGAAIVDALLHPQSGMLRGQAVVMVTHARQNILVAQRVLELQLSGVPNIIELDSTCGSPSSISRLVIGDTESSDAEPLDAVDGDASTAQGVVSSPEAPQTKAPHLLGSTTQDKLVVAETTSGDVRIRTYWDYFRMGGGWTYFLTSLFTLAAERCCFVGSDVWLSIWTSAAGGDPQHDVGRYFGFPAGDTPSGARFYLKVYACIVAVIYFMCCLRLSIFGAGGYFGAQRMFRKAFAALTTCPMSYFDSTPTGRMLNRMTHDVERVQFPLITQMNSMVASTGWLLTGLAVIVAVAPVVLAVVVPAIIGVGYYVYLYRPVNVHLQRLDSSSRSLLQGHLFESIHGAVTIRSLGQQKAFFSKFQLLIDDNTKALYAVCMCQRWISMRAETLGIVMACFVCLLMWIMRDSVSPGNAGMAIVWGLNMSRSVSFSITDGIQGQAKLVSVERLVDFIEELPLEAPRRTDKDPQGGKSCSKEAKEPLVGLLTSNKSTSGGACDWFPSEGTISFEDVEMRYRPGLPQVLRQCSFTIRQGERIGVVGRTGSGKSSLIVALYRLRELEGGTIRIDGHDISTLGLDMIRGGKMSIIPQDPILFTGTIRSNVDPFGNYGDEEVMNALKTVTLWTHELEANGGLAAVVEDRGKNFSVGQRQLMCIARALLKRPAILLMDEATANVDHDTDGIIQEAVRTQFKQSTVVEVAHRLHTVMDTDRVLVMQFGQVVEFDSPRNLLTMTDRYHHFRQMVEATGPVVSQQLKEIALGHQSV